MLYNDKEDLEVNYLGESCYDMFYKKKTTNIFYTIYYLRYMKI